MAAPTALLKAAAIARYRGDVPLQGLLGNPSHVAKSIFDMDTVPVNYPFPYVTVALPVEELGEAETTAKDAMDSYLLVTVFAESSGFEDATAMFARIHEITNRVPFPITGFNQFDVRFRDKRELGDGLKQQIPIRFKCMTQDA